MQDNKEYAKLRKKGIHPDFEEKLDRMFKGTSATGMYAYIPGASPPLPESPNQGENQQNLEESSNSEDTSHPTKRRKGNAVGKGKGVVTKPGRVGGAALLAQKIDRMCEAIESRSTASSMINKSVETSDGTSIKEVMKVVSSLPGAEQGTKMFFFASRLFLNKEKREMFCCMEGPHMKLEYLKFEMAEN